MKEKFAFFDFDKTLIDRDSIFLLWKYSILENPVNILFFIRKLFPKVFLWLFSGFQFRHIKNGLLSIFEKTDGRRLEKFVTEDLSEHFFPEGLEKVTELKEKGYRLVLVSASPELYLKYVAKILPFDTVIGTLTDEHFKMSGKNNRGEEKVRRIKEYCRDRGLIIDYDNSLSFSDSYRSDRPMMELTAHRFLINSSVEEEGYQQLHWTL